MKRGVRRVEVGKFHVSLLAHLEQQFLHEQVLIIRIRSSQADSEADSHRDSILQHRRASKRISTILPTRQPALRRKRGLSTTRTAIPPSAPQGCPQPRNACERSAERSTRLLSSLLPPHPVLAAPVHSLIRPRRCRAYIPISGAHCHLKADVHLIGSERCLRLLLQWIAVGLGFRVVVRVETCSALVRANASRTSACGGSPAVTSDELRGKTIWRKEPVDLTPETRVSGYLNSVPLAKIQEVSGIDCLQGTIPANVQRCVRNAERANRNHVSIPPKRLPPNIRFCIMKNIRVFHWLSPQASTMTSLTRSFADSSLAWTSTRLALPSPSKTIRRLD
jgi:hypothetical protein